VYDIGDMHRTAFLVAKLRPLYYVYTFFRSNPMFFLMQTFASDFIDLRQKSPLFSKIISTFVPTTENHE